MIIDIVATAECPADGTRCRELLWSGEGGRLDEATRGAHRRIPEFRCPACGQAFVSVSYVCRMEARVAEGRGWKPLGVVWPED